MIFVNFGYCSKIPCRVNRFMIKKLAACFLLITAFAPCIAQSITPTIGEFVGPFPSWLDAKKNFGAKGDGKTDDTRALQAGLDAAATDPNHSVLFLPAGAYRISRTLNLNNRLNLSLIGEDPARVSIIWVGAPRGTMLNLNGTAYSKFNRITFDGRGQADVAVEQSWDGKNGHFDTANEYADDVFTDVGFGIRGGFLGHGFAETSILRDHFIRNRMAGVSLGNFNALDIWVRDCLFQDCGYGVTNTFGAGNFKVYHSHFQRSVKSDMAITNTGEFSIRSNTSVGSAQFFNATFTRNPACITIEHNTVLDPLNTTAVSVSNQGPVIFIANTIRSQIGASGAVVRLGTDSYCIDNTFSVDQALVAGSGSIIQNTHVASLAELSKLKPVQLSSAEPNLKRKIFEVPVGATAAVIQSIIDRAAKLKGNKPVVHFPFGNYPLNTTLTIPAGSDMQLVGDGFGDQRGSTLSWAGPANGAMIHIAGPSGVTLKDLTLRGGTSTTNLLLTTADQQGALVFLQGFQQIGGQTGLLANRLDHAQIFGQDVGFSGLKIAINIAGGQSRTIVYSGAESNNVVSHQVTDGGSLMIQDTWYEGAVKSTYAKLSGNSVFTAVGDHIATTSNVPAINVQGFSGKAMFVACDLFGPADISGADPKAQLVALGMLAENDPLVPGSPGRKANVLLNRARTHGSTVINGGSYRMEDSGAFQASFTNELTNNKQPEKDQSGRTTSITLYRVMSMGGGVGLDVEGR